MKIGYLDCFSGISGDMFLGALVDAGVSLDLLRHTAASLNVGAALEIERVDRSGLSAVRAQVLDPHARPNPDHNHDHGDDHSPSHGRSLSSIRNLIARANLAPEVKELSVRAFDLLGASEAKMHNFAIEQVHFHEVGAVDAIVDIVCGSRGAFALGVDRWLCSPLNVGSGTVQCAHGRLPVPAPATLDLLGNAPIYADGPEGERVTPTGAALVRALGCSFAPLPPMRVTSTGYGAGSRNPAGFPNVLRLLVGESVDAVVESPLQTEAGAWIAVLETAIDDSSPQVLAYWMETALAAGAHDVMATPVYMKKNRPGTLLTILCEPAHAARFREMLFRETSTIGVRTRFDRRDCLERESVKVRTEWGEVSLKVARLAGAIVNSTPEYEDCRRLAQLHGIPLKRVQQAALTAYLNNESQAAVPESRQSEAYPTT